VGERGVSITMNTNRKVVVSSKDKYGRDIGLYEGECCDVGTCTRPPNHKGRHDQFDAVRSSDTILLHLLEVSK
jgi:hypothetical protein